MGIPTCRLGQSGETVAEPPQRILAHLLCTRDVLCGLHTRTWEAALSGQVPSLLGPQFLPLYLAGCELTSKR